jgi:anti-sigma B factor antagonist
MLSMTIQKLGDVSVFHGSGRITAGEEDRLRNAVRSQSRIRAVVLDFAEISAIDAAGLGMLASLRAWSKEAGIELKVMNVTPRVEEVLQLTNLHSALEVCSVREMVDLLCRARHLDRFETAAAVAAA